MGKDHETKRKSLLVRLQQKLSGEDDEPIISKQKVRKLKDRLNDKLNEGKDGWGDDVEGDL